MTETSLPTITVVFRSMSPAATVELSTALYDCGVRGFEVTMTGDRPMETVALLGAELPADALVGAGTVTTAEEVAASAAAGARFVVSPHLDTDVVARTRGEGLVSVPGAFTPTEIMAARRAGADVVKVFPVNAVGADYVRQLRGPMPDLRVMASGGVTPELARELGEAGVRHLAVGHHLLGAQPDGTFDPARVRERTREFLRACGVTA